MMVRSALGVICMVLAVAGRADGNVTQFTGRMFTTHEERNILDKMRQDIDREAGKEKRTAQAPKPTRRAPPLRVDGVVVRSDGHSTVWLDGQPVSVKGREQDIRIETGPATSAGVRMSLPDGARSVHLKPGQRYHPRTGQVTESFRSVSEETDDGTKEAARNAPLDN